MRKTDAHDIPDAEVLALIARGGDAYGELQQLYPERAVASKILELEDRGLVATGLSIARPWLTSAGKTAVRLLPVKEKSRSEGAGAELPRGARSAPLSCRRE